MSRRLVPNDGRLDRRRRAVGGVPLVGPLATLVAYLLVIRWHYGVGWLRAGGNAVVAWVAALVVLTVVSVLGATSLSIVGVPNA